MYLLSQTEREIVTKGMKSLLDEYGYTYQGKALDKILDEWAKNKKDLIEGFKKHPNYVADRFLIAFDADFDREYDKNAINSFKTWSIEIIKEYAVKKKLPDEVERQRVKERCNWLPNKMFEIFYHLGDFSSKFLTQAQADQISEAFPAINAKKGQKTSRVINSLCAYLGYDKHPEYNRQFAKYADGLNPLHITRHIVLSVNPLDYLTMSFGNSWASCHTIDKLNKRGLPDNYFGCYSSGTMSYMLDGTSIVMYTVDSKFEGTDYYFQDKVTRQMYHYGEDKLIQGRLYPQSNDSDKDIYTPYRNIAQKVISECFDFPNLWTIKKGTDEIEDFVNSCGTHYCDYSHFNACTISFRKDIDNDKEIEVGHRPICIECGYAHDEEDCINCCTDPKRTTYCYECGCKIDEDDAYEYHGEYYCYDCVTECDECGEMIPNKDIYEIDGDYFCECCRDRYYFCCANCGEYHKLNTRRMTKNGEYLCQECYEEYCEENPDEKEKDLITNREPAAGDIVKIRTDLSEYTRYHCEFGRNREYGNCVVSDMFALQGKLAKVIEISSRHQITLEGSSWNWVSGMFEGIVVKESEEE